MSKTAIFICFSCDVPHSELHSFGSTEIIRRVLFWFTLIFKIKLLKELISAEHQNFIFENKTYNFLNRAITVDM